MRRSGDTIKIAGDYQYKALTQGNAVQRFWHYTKQSAITRYLPPAQDDAVLDVGCGSGVITSFLGSFGATVVGFDGNPDAIAFATETFSRPNVRFQLGLVDENLAIDQRVDKIYCLEVIEHIYRHQGETMLRTFHRLLSPGGQVFLTTPNYRSLWPLIEWVMDLLRLSPPLKDHQHVQKYHKGTLEQVCYEAGFEIELISTTCLIAPWLAPLSWSFAKVMDNLEPKFPFFWGSILVCVLRKPEESANSERS